MRKYAYRQVELFMQSIDFMLIKRLSNIFAQVLYDLLFSGPSCDRYIIDDNFARILFKEALWHESAFLKNIKTKNLGDNNGIIK